MYKGPVLYNDRGYDTFINQFLNIVGFYHSRSITFHESYSSIRLVMSQRMAAIHLLIRYIANRSLCIHLLIRYGIHLLIRYGIHLLIRYGIHLLIRYGIHLFIRYDDI